MSSRFPARPSRTGLRRVPTPDALGRHGRRARRLLRQALRTKAGSSASGTGSDGLGLDELGWAVSTVAKLPLSRRYRDQVWAVVAAELCPGKSATTPREQEAAVGAEPRTPDPARQICVPIGPVASAPSVVEALAADQSASADKKSAPAERAAEYRRLLADGVVKNRAELARREGISRSRVTQILGPDPRRTRATFRPPRPRHLPPNARAGTEAANPNDACRASPQTTSAVVNLEEYRGSKRYIQDDVIREFLKERFGDGSLKVARGPSGRDVLQVYVDGKQVKGVPCERKGISPWLMAFVEEHLGGLLTPQQRNTFADFVVGRGRYQRPSEIKSGHELSLLESSPTIAAVVEHMRDKHQFEDTMAHLCEDLKKLAEEGQYSQRGSQRIPQSPSVLSRRLKAERSGLKAFGITVKICRNNGSKVTLTRRADATNTGPSEDSSDSNSSTGQDLPGKRTADPAGEYLRNRIRQKVDGVCSLVKQGEDV